MPVTRRRVRDEDDETEEEPEERPRRRRAAAEEEPEEDERPARRRRARAEEEPEEERPRKRRSRARDDDDDDDEGTPRKRSTGSVRSGWKGAKENKAKGGDFLEDAKIEKEPDLFKFLEDEPFASYRQHWVETPPAGIKKKSWICIEDGCPLCDLGDKPRMLTSFNVLHLSTGGAPENKILTLGNKALGQLEAFATDPKTGPLTKLFWAISKSGKNQSTAYNFRPVKERDLEEDWGIEDLDEVEDAIEDAMEKVYSVEDLNIPSKKQLREVSAGLTDDYDDDEDDD